MEKNFPSKDFKKICLKKFIDYNFFLGGPENSCVPEMQSFVWYVKQRTCILDLKSFYFYFNRALRFLLAISRTNRKIFFLGLPLGIEDPFMEVLKKLDDLKVLRSFVIKKEITGILTNFRKLKFKEKLEGVTMSIFKKPFLKKKKTGLLIKNPHIKFLKKWINKNPKKKRLVILLKAQAKKKRLVVKSQNLDFIAKPALIFVFQPLEHKDFLEKLSNLNIPIMGFVNTNEPINYYDFPIPGNSNSLKGSLFVYNMFCLLSRFKSLKSLPSLPFLKKKGNIKTTHTKYSSSRSSSAPKEPKNTSGRQFNSKKVKKEFKRQNKRKKKKD